MSALNGMLSEQPLPPSRNRRSPIRRVVLAAGVLAVLAIVVLVVVQLRSTADSMDYAGPGTGSVVVVVRSGDTLTAIGNSLEAADVVRSADAFLNAAQANNRASSIGPGSYRLPQQMRAADALAAMLDPASRAESRLVIPEGLRLDQTVDRIAGQTDVTKRSLRQALQDGGALGLPEWSGEEPEGFLFPATYELTGEETAESVLRTLVRRFNQAAADVNLEARASEVGRSPYEILIIASLIEAEVAPADFPKAARVVYNRLEADMPLQFDSTVGYALGITELQLSKDQMETDSPFNTYRNRGLPPTPINSPGEAALEAALQPAKGKWLYFVSVDPEQGITKFTANYEEFLEFKREFRRNIGAQ
jgi:UPF0755 protein